MPKKLRRNCQSNINSEISWESQTTIVDLVLSIKSNNNWERKKPIIEPTKRAEESKWDRETKYVNCKGKRVATTEIKWDETTKLIEN